MQRRVLIYAMVIVASVATIAGLLHLGETWFPASGVAVVRDAAQAPLTSADTLRRPLALLIIQLLVIVLATQMGGSLATLVGQPAVIGEIAAGLVLGPSTGRPVLAGGLTRSSFRTLRSTSSSC